MYNTSWWAVLASVVLAVAPVWGQGLPDNQHSYDPTSPQRLGQSGMTFLQAGGSARAEALGGAFTAVQGDPSSVFYNVAGMTGLSGITAYVNQTDWFVDMALSHFAVAMPLGSMRLGISFLSMDYGEIVGTQLLQGADILHPDAVAITGEIDPAAWAAGAFLAVPLTDRFSFGVQVKYSVQDFGAGPNFNFREGSKGEWVREDMQDPDSPYTFTDLNVHAWAFDLGSQYDTGFRNLLISMSMQNFAKPKEFFEGGLEFNLPLTYRIGLSTDAIEMLTGQPSPTQTANLYLEAVDGRDVLLDAAFGIEYLIDMSAMSPGVAVALRGGRRAAADKVGHMQQISGTVFMEQVFEVDHTEARRDADGNIMRDGQGNPINLPYYKPVIDDKGYFEDRLSLGAGLTLPLGNIKVGIDYSYSDYGPEFTSHMWGLSLMMR